MTPKILSILVIGGEASSEHGPVWMPSALAAPTRRCGYIPRLTQQLQRAGWHVQIETHSPVDIDVALPLLHKLNLNRFDLIVMELGHARLRDTKARNLLRNEHRHMPDTKAMSMSDIALRCTQNQPQRLEERRLTKLTSFIRLSLLRAFDLLNQVGRLREVNGQLTDLLQYLQPHRRRLILLTPLPHQQPVSHWLRQKGRDLFWQHGRRSMIPVFDTHGVIGTGEEYFVGNSQNELSATAGDLLGQTLFDYIQINALLPARPELRQRRGY